MDKKSVETLWTHLHWLVVLSQQGSFTAAARRLGVSKAAVSQRIAELEQAASVPLVQRTTRSMRLTEAGQHLVEEMRPRFENIAQSFAGLRDLSGIPRGLLRVTAPVALARQQLVPRLPQFLQRCPEVRIELDLSDHFRSLAVEGFDLAIRHTAAPPDTHVAWMLCETRSVLVSSPSYLDRRGTPKDPGDLRSHDCLHYPRGQETPVWHFSLRSQPHAPRITVPVAGSFAANNSEALREAAIAGQGIAMLPDFTAQAALRANELIEVLTPWQSVGAFADQLYAVRPYASHVPSAVTAFITWLRSEWTDGFGA